MDVSQALADLAEVRSRLAAAQRFRGLSAGAAAASGVAALLAGAYQLFFLPYPATPSEVTRYVALWTGVLVFALATNYGALLLWLVRHWSSRARSELRTAGMTIAPAIVAGGVFTLVFLQRDLTGLLPGTWCVCYALGLLASWAMLPRGVLAVAALFACAGVTLLFAHDVAALRWWVMPVTFGIGQLAIGALVARDEVRYAAEH